MIYRYLLSLACSFCFAVVSAQEIGYARDIVKYLSSENVAGRGYVDEGVELAAQFIQEEYAKHRLEAFSPNYRQDLTVDVNTFPRHMVLKINGQEFKAGQDFIIDPSSGSLSGDFALVYLKKRELENLKKVKKVIRSSAKKVLVIDERDYSEENKDLDRQFTDGVSYLKYSADVKVAAVIVLTKNKLTWSVSSKQISRPVFILNTDAEVKPSDNATINVEAEFKNHYPTSNLVGFHKGTEVPDSFLVLTAHYDHLGKMGGKVYIPGANDNASGVAMLLSLAKHFDENPPRYSIVYIATAAEELGLIGARFFVEHPYFELKKIRFLVNFDLAGTGDEGIKIVNGKIFTEEFDRIKQLNEVGNYLPAVKNRGEACISDHCMFYRKGVPSFYSYTLGGIKAYHDINDKYETLPFTRFWGYKNLMIDFIESF